MYVLIVNAGSSSLKLALLSYPESADPLWTAHVDGRGRAAQVSVQCRDLPARQLEIDASSQDEIGRLIESIWQGDHAVISAARQIRAVGHRVVHGGQAYDASVVIDEPVMKNLRKFIELAPEHEPANIKAIELACTALPEAIHVAVFDTAYHHNMPMPSCLYATPISWFEELGIRRYGFHGINHQYCASRAAELLGPGSGSRIITCHLGAGGSLCASLAGRSVITSMGFTPLDGLVMRTRSGAVDPGIILHLLRHGVYSNDELLRLLNEESGLKGISGLSGDMREIEKELAGGNERAKLAFDIYIQNLAANIAGHMTYLAGLDALVFSGGVGENSSLVRAESCKRLSFLGLALDDSKNHSPAKQEREISSSASMAKVLVIPAREDLALAAECFKLLAGLPPEAAPTG